MDLQFEIFKSRKGFWWASQTFWIKNSFYNVNFCLRLNIKTFDLKVIQGNPFSEDYFKTFQSFSSEFNAMEPRWESFKFGWKYNVCHD